MNTTLRITALALILTLSACASSHIIVGTRRAPISPESVRIYLHAPPHYEEVALLEASSQSSWAITSQGKTNKVIERLKQEAAALGANGVLLHGTRQTSGGSVSTGNATVTGYGNTAYASGTSVSVPITHMSGSGTAIYVPGQ